MLDLSLSRDSQFASSAATSRTGASLATDRWLGRASLSLRDGWTIVRRNNLAPLRDKSGDIAGVAIVP